MSAAPLLAVSGLHKRFGGLVATRDVNLDIPEGETHGLIGPNGAGKTTLIAQLQGDLTPTAGAIRLRGRDIIGLSPDQRARLGVARSFQIAALLPEFSALDNVALAVQGRLGHSFRFWKAARRDAALIAPAREALEAVGLEGEAGTLAASLSHGARRQLELAIALAMKPTLLLLDEPMAGLGKLEAAAMVRLIARLKGAYTILLVEHDMDAVFALCDRISVLVAGAIVATGAPDQIRDDARVRAAYLGH